MSAPLKLLELPLPVQPIAPSAANLRQALLTNREQTLTQLYQRTFPMVRRHVQRHGGSEQDAQDVFHDALVVFYEKTVRGTLHLTAAPSTYLVGVCRNLWQREVERRRRQPQTELTAEDAARVVAEADAPEPRESPPVLEFVERLGAKCRSVLLAFYYFQQPLEQIAAEHAYAGIRSATVQKFKCLERLRRAVRAAWFPNENR
ncbi:sigma-70 family RNA polymerase sigma factor [Hymenobacter busanensis]|uniref:Sigma-70 family RNA polymerase sigma factor n=1 Tax=Hymenobacter busanensis TaxID=2607656 RepID=A0A7L4ZSY3_9BACT|nr:sigma-70 family RNA polymerase sigma factor [Hymenobacter busanensis]KAA9327442.1 sigma-70 family RNA polymerase sigma factor [Hymenobacter busanensis]QHJ06221.1 sigma-70 family RNA polymerase sigma factor [Hymenobacter busanensis]